MLVEKKEQFPRILREYSGNTEGKLSLQSQLDLEGLGRPEIEDFRYFSRARILAAFLMLSLATFIDFL